MYVEREGMMGIYYFLVDETDNIYMHLDDHIKKGPSTFNEAIHMAYVNYMFDHQGHKFTIISDGGDSVYENTELNLLDYGFDKEVSDRIVESLNKIYEGKYYNYETVEGRHKIRIVGK